MAFSFAEATNEVNLRRSKFKNRHRHLTTMNAGFLVPLGSWDVLPGSTWKIDASVFMRGSTPIHPVFDDAYLDIFFFWVPARLTFSDWKKMFGEPDADPYAEQSEIIEPGFYRLTQDEENQEITRPGVITRRSLAAYYGVPIGSRPEWLNAKYARGYGLIWNRWFRAQTLQQAIDVPTDNIDRPYYRSDNVDGVLPDVQADPDYYIDCAKDYGHLAPVCKYFDYFTSALRQPQRGDPASIPLNGIAPVYAIDGVQNVFYQGPFNQWLSKSTLNGVNPGSVDVHTSTKHNISGATLGVASGDMVVNTTSLSGTTEKAFLNNLVADLGMHEELSKSVGLAYSTITDLRYAFATQRFLEAESRFGSRYKEMLKAHFSVDANNIELQDPELLAHKKLHIQNNQVVQTSSTDDISPQGNLAAYSLTSDRDFYFLKSFTDYGVLHCLGCIRPVHTYQQGLAKKHSKRTKWDYYFPEYANISELPVKVREIYVDANMTAAAQDAPFGFNEAWSEYRVFPSTVSGQFHSGSNDSFDIWHYADYYQSAPTLSAGWIAETYKNIDRTLAVTSEVADQFKIDIAFNIEHVEPMPLYSIPGITPYL